MIYKIQEKGQTKLMIYIQEQTKRSMTRTMNTEPSGYLESAKITSSLSWTASAASAENSHEDTAPGRG